MAATGYRVAAMGVNRSSSGILGRLDESFRQLHLFFQESSYKAIMGRLWGKLKSPLFHEPDVRWCDAAFQYECTSSLLRISPFRPTCPIPLPSSIGRSTRSIAGQVILVSAKPLSFPCWYDSAALLTNIERFGTVQPVN